MNEKVTDEMLMAYVDGELDPAAQQELRAAMVADPVLAARADAFALSRRLARAAFGPELERPVPARLVETVMAGSSPASRERKILPFTARRVLPVALPLAASIAAAFTVFGFWYSQQDQAPGEILGPSRLALALAETPAGERTSLANGAEIATVGSYRVVDGICRVFEVAGGTSDSGMRGVGCARGTAGWSIDLAVAGSAREAYTPASAGLSDSIDAYLDALEAEPLTAEEDRLNTP